MEFAGRYSLRRRVAAGGMGEVWEATATGERGFSRRVAVKRMIGVSPRSEPEARMFLDEARIASQLHHANIVSILDFGLVDGAPFQVLEYVEGINASELEFVGRNHGRPLPVALALHICVEVAHALHYAHTATDAEGKDLRIVHRDVTPHNILVSWTGDVKLTDFGIAVAEGRLERTLAGVAKGKPAYMSPEQAMAASVDHRTDVFALGCVLHALLTGHTPLAGESRLMDLLAGIELPLEPSLDDDVKEIIRRAVRRERHERFDSADAFARACGIALHARLAQDARSALCEFLAEIREFTSTSRSVHELQTPPAETAAPTTKEHSLPTTAIARPAAMTADTQQAPAAARLRRPLVGGIALAAALAVVGAVVLPLLPAEQSAAPVEAGVNTQAAPQQEAAPAPAPQPREAVAVEAAPVVERAKEASARPPRRQQRPAPAPKEQGTGMVAIGGVGAHQSEIFVRGRSYGFAPKLVELPVGDHEVALVTPSGERHHKKLTVSIRNTATHPLRWLVEESARNAEAP